MKRLLAAACMLAADLANERRLVAIMDIGTNTELIVGNRDRILAASCPAGPAFEGGAITCGMPALDGAIEEMLDSNGPYVLDIMVPYQEHVLPMIPGGMTVRDIIKA